MQLLFDQYKLVSYDLLSTKHCNILAFSNKTEQFSATSLLNRVNLHLIDSRRLSATRPKKMTLNMLLACKLVSVLAYIHYYYICVAKEVEDVKDSVQWRASFLLSLINSADQMLFENGAKARLMDLYWWYFCGAGGDKAKMSIYPLTQSE